MLIVETKMMDGTVFHSNYDEMDAYHAVVDALEFGAIDPRLIRHVRCEDSGLMVIARPANGVWRILYDRKGVGSHEITVPWRE